MLTFTKVFSLYNRRDKFEPPSWDLIIHFIIPSFLWIFFNERKTFIHLTFVEKSSFCRPLEKYFEKSNSNGERKQVRRNCEQLKERIRKFLRLLTVNVKQEYLSRIPRKSSHYRINFNPYRNFQLRTIIKSSPIQPTSAFFIK